MQLIKNFFKVFITKILYHYFDKGGKFASGLIDVYRKQFRPFKYKKINILEIGIEKGGSLLFWSGYFKHPGTRIIGIDIALPSITFPRRVTARICDQNDSETLQRIAKEFGPFDIIIDDASHFTRETSNCFENLLSHLKPEGLYVIEDWSMGYLGKSKYSGMVELVSAIVNRAPTLGIDSFKVTWDMYYSTAIFRKKSLKQKHVPVFIKEIE